MALVIPGKEKGTFEQVRIGANWSDDKKWDHIAGKVGELIEERMHDLVNDVIALIEDEVIRVLHKVEEEEDEDDYGYSRFLTEEMREWPEIIEDPEIVEMDFGDDNEGDDYEDEEEMKAAWSGWDNSDEEEYVTL